MKIGTIYDRITFCVFGHKNKNLNCEKRRTTKHLKFIEYKSHLLVQIFMFAECYYKSCISQLKTCTIGIYCLFPNIYLLKNV